MRRSDFWPLGSLWPLSTRVAFPSNAQPLNWLQMSQRCVNATLSVQDKVPGEGARSRTRPVARVPRGERVVEHVLQWARVGQSPKVRGKWTLKSPTAARSMT